MSALSDPAGLARPISMKTKRVPGDTRAAALDSERRTLQRQLDAIGAANKWLRTSLAKERGRYIGERDVALLVCPVFENPGPGRLWVAVLYTAENPETPRTRRTPTSREWTGTDWFTALTSAVFDLVSHDVRDMAERRSDVSWFKFETIDGKEIIP